MAEAQNSPTLGSARAGGPPSVGSTTAGSIAVAAAAESTVATRMSAPPSFDVADFPVPHGREEEWRFTPLERLRGLHDGTAEATGAAVKVDVTAPEGVTVRDRRTATDAARRQGRHSPSTGSPPRRTAPSRRPRCDHHPQGHACSPSRSGSPCTARAARPTATRSSSSAPSPRPSSSSTTPVTPCSPPTSSTSSATAPSSPSSPSRTGTTTAVHVAQHNALIGRDATFKSVVVTFGGDLVRLAPARRLRRPGRRGRAVRPVLRRRRPAPGAPAVRRPRRCRTASPTSLYKGALQGQDAHTVWIGDVLIRPEAEGTDTYEMNRNLVLTDGARADSVPNLEIETGEIVGAGHASRPPAGSTTSSCST